MAPRERARVRGRELGMAQVVTYQGHEWKVVRENADGMITLRRRGTRAVSLFNNRVVLFLPCCREATAKRSAVTRVVPIR